MAQGPVRAAVVLESISVLLVVELRDICIFYQPLKKSIKEAVSLLNGEEYIQLTLNQ
jgi:hypothetical protein